MTVPTPFWSLHTHSRYSANDAMPKVDALVAAAASLDYPALGLTDHGTVSGVVQLYKAARKKGIEPLPGIELYVTADREQKKQGNMHLTMAALSETGYRNLVGVNNMATRNFYYKPRIDMADFAGLAEDGKTNGLVVGTGCYFGIVQQALIHQGYHAARQIVATLAGWFPNVYVELHNHGVPRETEEELTEDEICRNLISIADELGLPYIIAADSHYISPDEQVLHDALKRMVSFSDDVDEAVFPGGPYSLLSRDDLKQFFEPWMIEQSCDNLAALAERCHVRLPELEEFQLKVPDVSLTGDAQRELEDLVWSCYEGQRDEQSLRAQRIRDELEVIRISGMAGYVLLVWDVCRFMLENDIWFHTRGSASGSYVMYLIKVTQVDPIDWGLRMDRFMSTDRTRPPDVDLDVQHDRRDEVIVWLGDRFSVRQVGSHMQMGLTSNEEDEGKGSLLIKYFSSIRKRGGAGGGTWSDIPANDKLLLKRLASYQLISGPGTHAAGYIVAPDERSVAQLPLSMIPGRKAMVTAYGKKDVEALGFCKLDLLGLRTKTGVRMACEYLSDNPREFYESIPTNDKEVFRKLGTGQVEGVFQLEGVTFARGCREMKPRNLKEVVAIQALFRPGMTGSKLDKRFLARRARKEPMPDLHPDILAITKETYGVALYQEQIMALMRAIGMNADELTDTLDAVKASNAGTEQAREFLHSIEGRVSQLATDRGWSPEDVGWLVDGLAGYAEYSFNKAHAASYGIESYRTAWLTVHHPMEFWAGMLVAYVGHKNENVYVAAARKNGVRVLPAHVNYSAAMYSIDRKKNAIRKGLLAIKGVGRVAAAEIAEKAPFSSLTDLGERCIPRKVSGSKGLALKKPPPECGGVVAALYDYGALDGLDQ